MRTCEHANCNQPVFGTDRKTQKGYCKSHQWCRIDLDKRTAYQKHFDQFKANIEEDVELEKWFEEAAKELAAHPYCMECGTFIPKKYYRAATAHVLAKAIFDSVKTHPMNRIFLGAGCGCHHKFDNGGMEDMQVLDEAVRRYSLFRLEVLEKHKILHTFERHLDNQIVSAIL